MRVKSFTVNPFAENTFLLIEDEKALLVDPGFYKRAEFDACTKIMHDLNADLIGILLTHAHVDHILGVSAVKNEFDIPVYLNHEDLYLWKNFASQAVMFGFQTRDFDFEPEPLNPQKNWNIGPFAFDVLFTPGHAPEHISLYSEKDQVVIAGDSLFKGGIGRTDLYKGDRDLLVQSIREKLYTLPDKTQVLPGHGQATTIGYEKKHNEFVKAAGQESGS